VKRLLVTLGLGAALLVGLASTAAGASVSRLQMINDVLYPESPAAQIDYICDGVAPCVALPGAAVIADTGATTVEALDPEAPYMFNHVYVRPMAGASLVDYICDGVAACTPLN